MEKKGLKIIFFVSMLYLIIPNAFSLSIKAGVNKAGNDIIIWYSACGVKEQRSFTNISDSGYQWLVSWENRDGVVTWQAKKEKIEPKIVEVAVIGYATYDSKINTWKVKEQTFFVSNDYFHWINYLCVSGETKAGIVVWNIEKRRYGISDKFKRSMLLRGDVLFAVYDPNLKKWARGGFPYIPSYEHPIRLFVLHYIRIRDGKVEYHLDVTNPNGLFKLIITKKYIDRRWWSVGGGDGPK